jgi:transposase
MALVLEDSARREIISRRRYTLDKRVADRLSAVLWTAEGRTSREVAGLLGVTSRAVRKWLRLFRTNGLDALCALGFRGDPGKLSAAQVERLKGEVATGRFLAARQICDWVLEAFGVAYSARGMRGLLHRIGVSYHKVTGFLWKADPGKQEEFLKTHQEQKRQADGRRTRR